MCQFYSKWLVHPTCMLIYQRYLEIADISQKGRICPILRGRSVDTQYASLTTHFITMSSQWAPLMASEITCISSVCSTIRSGSHQRKHQSSASLAFVRGNHHWPVDSPYIGPIKRKMFPFDDVIMYMNSTKFEGSIKQCLCLCSGHDLDCKMYFHTQFTAPGSPSLGKNWLVMMC